MPLIERLGFLAILVVLLNASCTMIGSSEIEAPSPETVDYPVSEELRTADALTNLEETPNPVPIREDPSLFGNMVEYDEFGITYRILDSSEGYEASGIASWYGEPFHGRRTSSGEIYDMYAMSGAHRSLPLPSYVEVTNLDNGRSVTLRINDRGPFVDPELRIIDVSYTAALKLGMIGPGTVRVRVKALEPWQKRVH